MTDRMSSDDEQMEIAVAALVEKLAKTENLTDALISREILATGDSLGYTVENNKRGTFYFKVRRELDNRLGRGQTVASQQVAPATPLTLLSMKIGKEEQFLTYLSRNGLTEQLWSGTDMWHNLLKFRKKLGQNVYCGYKRGLDWYLGLCPSEREMEGFYQYYRSGAATDLKFYVGNLPEAAFQQDHALN